MPIPPITRYVASESPQISTLSSKKEELTQIFELPSEYLEERHFDTITPPMEKLPLDSLSEIKEPPLPSAKTSNTYALAAITAIGILFGLFLLTSGSAAGIAGGCILTGFSLFSLIKGVILNPPTESRIQTLSL